MFHTRAALRLTANRFFSTAKPLEFDLEGSFKTYLCENPPKSIQTSKDELLKFYHEMYLVRRVETAADNLYKSKQIRGFCHLYTGQEAVCVGMEATLTKDDHVITAYRDHGNYICRGGTPGEMLAELLGKHNGCSKGNGGSMHMYSRKYNFYGGNGIVGAQIPVGAGIALAQKYKKTGNVTVSMYGDGAANQGQVFEAYNMAAIWKLPVIFVCENNHFAMGTSVKRATLATEYYKRGQYIAGLHIDGMNVLAVKAGFQYAVDHAKNNGPIVLELDTYRYSGHSMSDPGTTYRTRDDIAKVRETRDAIAQLKSKLISVGVTEEEIKSIESKVKEEVEEAIKFAKEGKEPPMEQLFQNIMVDDSQIHYRAVELKDSINPQGWPLAI